MSTPVICAYARTPFGRFRGALANYTAVELGTLAVEGVLERAGIDPHSGIIDQVYMGQVLQAGAGQAPARQVAIAAGMPYSTPCTTINKVCGSSLKAVMVAATEIMAGKSNVVIAGGVAANKQIRITLERLCQEEKFKVYFPDLKLCTDNAAMIALAGLERYKKKKFDKHNFEANPRWQLDNKAKFLKGAGVKI